MKRTLTPAALLLTILAAGLVLLAPGTTRAAAPTGYTLQPIVKLGDQVAGLTIKPPSQGGYFQVVGLNDSGQIAFVTENAAGGETLLQYSNGQFIPVVVGGGDAPGGKWAARPVITFPVSMNQRGNIAFSTSASIGGKTDQGTFRWDSQSQNVTAVAFKGLPALNNLTFVSGSTSNVNIGIRTLINNNDEVAFPASVRNAAGSTRTGAFFLGRDGQLQPVALPDQVLPGAMTVQDAYPSGLNDAGAIAFVTAAGSGSQPNGAYLWENGVITPVAVIGMEIPGLGKVASVFGFRVNNKDRTAVGALQLNSTSAPIGIYRWANGQFTLLFTEGQDMPGGGTLKQYFGPVGLNDAGQFAFPALLADGSTAAYLLDTDGTLSLILKSGASTPLGTITSIGPESNSSAQASVGIGLNSKGQVALPVKFGSGATTLVLLTPSRP